MKVFLQLKMVDFLNNWLVYLLLLAALFGTTLYIQQDFQTGYAQAFEALSRIKLKISLLIG